MNSQIYRWSDVTGEGCCFGIRMRRRAKWAIGIILMALIIIFGAWCLAQMTIEDIEAKNAQVGSMK